MSITQPGIPNEFGISHLARETTKNPLNASLEGSLDQNFDLQSKYQSYPHLLLLLFEDVAGDLKNL